MAGRLAAIPRQWRRRVSEAHRARLARRDALSEADYSVARRNAITAAAHAWLAAAADLVGAIRVPLDMSDADLCALAEKLARECMDLAGNVWLKTPGAIRARLMQFAAGYGIRPPGETVADGPAIARMTCPQWWRRGLRVYQARGLENAAIRLGYVRRGGEIYASDATVDRRAGQRRRNALMLESTDAINLDTGEICNLADLAARSVANPAIRRGELMTRLAGFDRVAADLGHVAEFATITCPARFHPYRGDGSENADYAGATPREAQGWLTKTWAKCRARLGRAGIRIYGIRVAEPHKTGTPHWHAVFFMAAGAVESFRAAVRDYFLGPDADAARLAHGVEFQRIDRSAYPGGAAGYLAKYIAKNIDGGGYAVQLTLEGGETVEPSARVEAWASTWGIRQFAQIGGPPVGVWREARRLEDGGEYTERIEAIRAAADVGQKTAGQRGAAAASWARYVELMGGPMVERRHLPARVAYTRPGERWDYAGALLYPANQTRYGETAPGAVYGIRDVLADRAFPGRRARWEIRRSGSGLAGGAGSWTRVNNCTQGVEDGTDGHSATRIAAQIQHMGGAEFADGAAIAGAGAGAFYGTGGGDCRNGGIHPSAGRDDGSGRGGRTRHAARHGIDG